MVNKTYSLNPADAGHHVVLEIAQLRHFARSRIPHVNATSKSDSQDIATPPIDQIQIKIVLQIRRIEHLVGHLADGAGLSARTEQHALTVETHRRETVDLRAGIETRIATAMWRARGRHMARQMMMTGRHVRKEILVRGRGGHGGRNRRRRMMRRRRTRAAEVVQMARVMGAREGRVGRQRRWRHLRDSRVEDLRAKEGREGAIGFLGCRLQSSSVRVL